MILVNYIGDFQATHPVFQHHNTYFSYADSIMPAFHFAVGFALRLTLLKRIATQGKTAAYLHVVWRCLGLILLSTVLELGSGGRRLSSWASLASADHWNVLAGFLKCDFWETLAIIGVTSLWVLPVIAARAWVRVAFLTASGLLHLVLSHWFYFDFLWARPNLLDPWWGAATVKGLDGGPLGFLTWCMPQLAGSLAYDVIAAGKRSALAQLLGWSALLMGLGYSLSYLAVRSSVAEGSTGPATPAAVAAPRLAEPPFVRPPEQRPVNLWTMSKRAGSLSFMLFATGFSLTVYAFFVVFSDHAGLQVGLFRTFGQNALAAYVIHEVVDNAVKSVAPQDSTLWWLWVTFALYLGITYLLVRSLEKNGIYLRL
jgi:hypothetical protein